MITSKDLREKYLTYFEKLGHTRIPSAPLVPENDASTLFNSAGMQPLVPYLLGEPHPAGVRLVNCQKCIRTGDIDEVGDAFHHTFFEMLGNWSLGDYFKKESIPWSFEFLTKDLELSPDRLSVSVFAGDNDAPRDDEAVEVWKSVGIPEDRIYYFGKEDNWWAAGTTGPCGPDTEIFYDVTQKPCGSDCCPGDNCGRYFEIWNNVFMVYNRKDDGSLEELPKKNVDTGMGLERTIAVLNGLDDNYKSDLFLPIIVKIEEVTGKKYNDNIKTMRRIADHVRAAVFIIAEGIEPSNVARGYILRRLTRRALRFLHKLETDTQKITEIGQTVISHYSKAYPELERESKKILEVLREEELKFKEPIDDLELYKLDLQAAVNDKIIKKIGGSPIINENGNASGQYVFENYQSYGVPPDLAEDIAEELGIKFDKEEFEKAMVGHQDKSRTAGAGMFKGGLAGDTPVMRKYHTTAHLLQAALRKVLGEHVEQAGQNITDARLRFDFKHPNAVTDTDKDKVEKMINEQIDQAIPVYSKVMGLEEAYKEGALGFFKDKYGDQVSVYTVGDPSGVFVSKEICGGPHVENTSEIGHVTIIKEESAGSGVRRIYIQLQ